MDILTQVILILLVVALIYIAREIAQETWRKLHDINETLGEIRDLLLTKDDPD
jgi:hypothetical protein